MKFWFRGAVFRRAELHEAQIFENPRRAELHEAPTNVNGDSRSSSLRCNSSFRHVVAGELVTTFLVRLFDRLRPRSTLHRYRVTPRHNAYAFRRALVREAMRELKRDSAFASLKAMNPDNILNRR